MKCRLTALVLTVTAAAGPAYGAVLQEGGRKPHILLLATGGTIAGSARPGADVRYASGQLRAEQLVAAVPALADLASIRAEQLASVGSQDMNRRIWVDLAHRIQRAFADPDVDGIVITHGTDTIEETAFFLDLVLPESKPVVLVGAMRPADAAGADGPANLLDAVKVAGTSDASSRGVLVVLNDTLHLARSVQKSNTQRLDAFESRSGRVAGGITSRGVTFYASPAAQPKPFGVPALPNWPQVEIIYAHADMDSRQITDALRSGARGLILAGVGDGNASKAALDALAAAARSGVLVVRSTRVPNGDVDRNVEIDDDALGFVAAEDLNPQKARILLQLLIAARRTNSSEVQKLFDGQP